MITRKMVLILTVVVLAAGAAAWQLSDASAPSGEDAPYVLGEQLPSVSAPPAARFARTMSAATSLKDSDPALDRCVGPVAIDVGSDEPTLISEHDYCGGSAWISKLADGDAVKLSGDGIAPGLYVVEKLDYEQRGNATVGDLPGTDIVLQTCTSKTEMVLVGMTKFAQSTDPA